MYDICFIGSGVATTFSLIHLAKNNYKGKVLILERGKALEDRTTSDIMYGGFGSGMFSDCKIVRSLKNNFETGGDIAKYLDNSTLINLDTEFLRYINIFFPKDKKLEIISPVKSGKVKYDPFKVLYNETIHIGSDWGKTLGKDIYGYLNTLTNYTFEYNVKDFKVEHIAKDGVYKIYTDDNKYYEMEKLVIGSGRSGSKLVERLKTQYNLRTQESELQIGIRVEVPNEIVKSLTDKFYDFKFVLDSEFGTSRSFCVSPSGQVIEEKLYSNTTFNGGNLKDTKTDKTNFGIMVSPKLPETSNKFNIQRNIVQQINLLPMNKRIVNFESWRQSIDLYNILARFNIHTMLTNWMVNFEKICPHFLENVKIYTPEVKYATDQLRLTKNFERDKGGMYIIGDAGVSRGIYQSAMSGIHLANIFMKK